MNIDSELKDLIEADIDEFAQLDTTKKSKEDMFYAIMGTMDFPDEKAITFHEAESLVEDLALKKKEPEESKKPRDLPFPTRFAQVLGGVAAVFALIVALQSRPIVPVTSTPIFSPPLQTQDVPGIVQEADSPFRTVATNNDFYLGYAETEQREGRLDLLVHSRSGEVDWDTLKAIDGDNDIVTPLSVNTLEQIVSLPAAETEILFQVQDHNGNTISCVLPTYI